MAKYMGPPRFESGFKDAPFVRNGTDLQNIFFQGVEPIRAGSFDMYPDANNRGYAFVQQLIEWDDTNKNGILDEGEIIKENFKMSIFVSHDVSYLKEVVENYEADQYELTLFIEDNATDGFSPRFSSSKVGGVMEEDEEGDLIIQVFAGAKVKGVLKNWFKKEYKNLLNEVQRTGLNIDLTKKELKELMDKGRVEIKNFGFVRTLVGIFSKAYGLGAWIYDEIGDAILMATGVVRYIRIDEYRWNPEKQQTDDGKDIDNSNFKPFLLPYTHEIIEYSGAQMQSGVEELTALLEKSLKKEKQRARGKLKKLHKLKGLGYISTKDLTNVLKKFEMIIDMGFTKLIDSCSQVVPQLIALGEKALNLINAFYCGLWNALIEAVLGLVDLVGYLFKGLALGYKSAVGMVENISDILEFIDETYQAIFEIEFDALISGAISSIYNGILTFDFTAMASGFKISLEQVAYFLGSFAGFVVELAVGIIGFPATGGTSSAVPVMSFLSKFKTLGTLLKTMVQQGIAKLAITGKSIIESILKLFNYILRVLNQGVTQFKKLIDDFFEALSKGIKETEAFIKAILKKLKLPDALYEIFEDLGLAITRYGDDACHVCSKI
ncbi:hypothetical protein [Maribacter flavus]|uniref:EF-hand domain-containing protein n=1 Tax=Maribacter flavus TaxID=1658664 RepID=A0A5B2TTW2_9FLAO|nr:hypothetical protein [Maribacter flavus]KAA2217195.1 hypothetical protein F0361_14630 [Maribacter flavus]